ncbi:MAG: orotate phosphoribosyltransferase [Schleiferiaceae bacterium]|nr:orotate phosphoribosyltransferase [Schleiferiaceae bacterium]
MIWNSETARHTADHLLQIKAIKLQPHKPFTWASGWLSPIYCDNRLALSHPSVRNFLRQQLAAAVRAHYPQPQLIAGVATGAIAIAALVAEEMELPMVYVRPEAKKHGRQNQIEGELPAPGTRTVVVEDLISTGGSSLRAVEALRQAGAEVSGMAGIFTYAFDVAKTNFTQQHCSLVTLCDYPALLQRAVDTGHINEEALQTLQEWRKKPDSWSPA